jgi:ABC-type nitrate/sulfonate/bicarbonate transport system substrate-binding protein
LNKSGKSSLVVLLFTLGAIVLTGCSSKLSESSSINTESAQTAPLRVAIAPYQDMSMLLTEKELGLEKKYGTKLELLTMPWEEIIPAVASAGQTVDIGFASIADYMCKSEHLNGKGDDPLLYIYPAYVFRGGAFMTFNPAMPIIDIRTIKDPAVIKKFLSYKLGVQKNSCCHMLLWLLAHNTGVKFSTVSIADTTLNDGMLAAENGSLDAAAAGLTQRTEALKRHGRVALDMETAGLVDITGFICKESVYKKRKKEIDSLIRIWLDCAHYVLSDIDHHSGAALTYLKANASTKYTIDEFKRALSQEYFPQSIAEEQSEIISPTKGKYSIARIATLCNQYLLDIGAIKTAQPVPQMITIK